MLLCSLRETHTKFMIPQTASAVGVLAVYLGLDVWENAQICVYVRSSLCAGCGLCEGHIAPVYAKLIARAVFAAKQSGFGTF